jgi:hypothetical protein
MLIFLKMDKVKGRKFYLSSGTNKRISNFRETNPLNTGFNRLKVKSK